MTINLTSAVVIADSQSKAEARLTTFQVTFPRFILAEVNTHREQSKNSASSRAIPPEKLIEMIQHLPFTPSFNRRATGMGVGKAVTPEEQKACAGEWNASRMAALASAKALVALDIDKSRINRLLEPFMWHTAILSATSWVNFFRQRKPLGSEVDQKFPAQLEMQKLALLMHEALMASTPRRLEVGEWHLPYVEEHERDSEFAPHLSAGRCARVSYLKHADGEDQYRTLERTTNMVDDQHWSPLEHPAQALQFAKQPSGNFSGFAQLRKMLETPLVARASRPDLDEMW